MSKQRTKYTTEFKTKVVLEALKNERPIPEIASEYNITPSTIKSWKKVFFENAEIAMDPAKAVREYKNEIDELKHENDRYAKIVGKMTIEKEWLEKKLQSLGFSDRKAMINPKHDNVSIVAQCKMLAISRTAVYYEPEVNEKKEQIKAEISKIYNDIPIYGAAKVHQQLLENGFSVCLNTVAKYRQEMGLKPVLAVKPPSTSEPRKEHKKHSYKLRDIDITHANQVWSTDITYVKINGGTVYLAAIIDWYSKAVLSYRISNTMDTVLVMDVLNEALKNYGSPEIFNTDQGSQYTSREHTETLSSNGIVISMDGKGRATDNICIERFWRSAKCECIYLNEYENMKQLKSSVSEYIDFYNHRRFHETLKYKKPMNVYKDTLVPSNEKLLKVA